MYLGSHLYRKYGIQIDNNEDGNSANGCDNALVHNQEVQYPVDEPVQQPTTAHITDNQ